jgi:hypothetical protein
MSWKRPFRSTPQASCPEEQQKTKERPMIQLNQQKKLNIKLDEKVGEGVYANFFMITNSPSEFIIDFGRILPGLPDARIYSRVLTTPQHAKQLMQILQQNIATFEEKNGEIKVPGKPDAKEIGFQATGQSS